MADAIAALDPPHGALADNHAALFGMNRGRFLTGGLYVVDIGDKLAIRDTVAEGDDMFYNASIHRVAILVRLDRQHLDLA